MPKRKVERASRTAFPAAVDAPGLGAVHRSGVRWGLRALVIGALAGAAWLLTGVAAQAADHDPTAAGVIPDLSLIDAAPPGDTTEPAVTGTPQAAAQPLAPDRRMSTIEAPKRELTHPVATSAETPGEDSAVDGVDRVGREITGTLRLTGGPVDSRLAPVTAALVPGTRGIRTVRTVTDPAPHAAVSAWSVDRPEVSALVTDAVDRGAARTSGSVSRRHPAVTGWASGTRRPAARPAAAPAAARKASWPRKASGHQGPVPVRVHLGGVGGLVACGSQAPTDGGSVAFLPVATAAGTVTVHRMPSPADAEIRRNDAEAPTVSPD